MEYAIWFHVVTVFSLVLFKLAVLFVGYLIARLGHDLLLKGVSGEFKFHSEIKGVKADLISASPGIFFILMATILIAVGVIKDKPFETRVQAQTIESGAEQNVPRSARGEASRPKLPPPGEQGGNG